VLNFKSNKPVRLYSCDGGRETEKGFFCNAFFIGLDGENGRLDLTTTDRLLAEKLKKLEGRDVVLTIAMDSNKFGSVHRLADVEPVK
jgi:hypothetical protein